MFRRYAESALHMRSSRAQLFANMEEKPGRYPGRYTDSFTAINGQLRGALLYKKGHTCTRYRKCSNSFFFDVVRLQTTKLSIAHMEMKLSIHVHHL